MISLTEFLMGREKQSPLSVEQALNAADLLSRVNYLFGRLNLRAAVTSGYRPSVVNYVNNGAKKSAHLSCQAIDLLDHHGKIGILLSKRTDLLEECGLYLENPSFTKKEKDGTITYWTHLQSRPTKNRIFNP